MNLRHEHEKKQFKKLFSQQGVDQFDKRYQILEFFLNSDNHITCQEIFQGFETKGADIDFGLIAETMELLCRFGFAQKVKFDGGIARYEHRHLGLHHDHMICTRCGEILEFRDELLERQQLDVARAYGFHMLQHRMEIYGLCSKCQEFKDLPMSLARAKAGDHLWLVGVRGGKKVPMRLSSMGLRVGDLLEIVSVQMGGQMVVAVEGSRFVVGQGLAQKIIVKRTQQAASPGVAPVDAQVSGNTMDVLSLTDVNQGQEAVVVKVSGGVVLRRRLLEMGINRGARVVVCKCSKFTSSLDVIIKGAHLTLDVEEASHISVNNITATEKPWDAHNKE